MYFTFGSDIAVYPVALWQVALMLLISVAALVVVLERVGRKG